MNRYRAIFLLALTIVSVGLLKFIHDGGFNRPDPKNFVQANKDWSPQFAFFNNVEMALVPPGCFNMGSENNLDESPIQSICVTKSFWIDRYEVTNKQYGSAGTFAGDNLPRDTVTWFESQAFCKQRDARLPTELEWEYAARGVDSSLYPWGNTFQPDKAAFWDNWGDTNRRTTDIALYPEGASWVGALDMSGNLWEWVSSAYKPYPYNAHDGREDANDVVSERVMRGGSWYSDAARLTTTIRGRLNPNTWYDLTGFRCVRDA